MRHSRLRRKGGESVVRGSYLVSTHRAMSTEVHGPLWKERVMQFTPLVLTLLPLTSRALE